MEHVTKNMGFGLELNYDIVLNNSPVEVTVSSISLKRVRYVSVHSTGLRLARILNRQFKCKKNLVLEYTPDFLDKKNGWRIVYDKPVCDYIPSGKDSLIYNPAFLGSATGWH